MSSFTVKKNGNVLGARLARQGETSPELVRLPKPACVANHAIDLGQDVSFGAGVRAFYEQLCSRYAAGQTPVRSLGLTSCYHGEGTTSVINHLASIAAQTRRVALIDANRPRPDVDAALRELAPRGIPRQIPALSSQAVKPLRAPGAGQLRASESTASHETRDLVRSLNAKFDLTLIDLPPLESAEAFEWAPALDGVVLVVESERVRWQVAARSIALLEQAGTQVLGIILNKQPRYIPQWLYQRL